MAGAALGDFSRMQVEAVKYANALQAVTIDHIKRIFYQPPKGFELTDGFLLSDFVAALLEADSRGEREEFERRIGEQLVALIPQVQAMMQQQGQPDAT